MTTSPIWITEAVVVSLISLPEAVEALERILAMEAQGGAANMPKTHLMVGENNAMHALGASVAGAGPDADRRHDRRRHQADGAEGRR